MLAKATGAIVNVDHLKVHGNQDGSVDKTKTDVLLHFVHPDNNTVMDVHDILRRLDYKTSELDPFFKTFNVLRTESSSNYLPLTNKPKDTVIISWLVGVCIFIIIILILIISLCLSQRSRYIRKLKAVTTQSYPIPKLSNKDDLVPNTNRHALEGSNPIWMSGMVCEEWTTGPEDEDAVGPVTDQDIYNQDSLDTDMLNCGHSVSSVPEGSITGFRMSGDVLYRSNVSTIQRDGSTDRQSDSSGRGSLYASSQFMQLNAVALPATDRLDNPRARLHNTGSD